MKKFRVKHGQCGSVIFSKTLSFESSKYLIAGSRILYFWQVLESIHKFIIELNALQCLFIWGLIKNKDKVGLFQISLKERLFISQPSALGVISQCGPPSCTLQKRPFLPLHFGQEENIQGHSTEKSLLVCFENFQDALYSHRKSRNRMVNTFIIVNIIPTCKR